MFDPIANEWQHVRNQPWQILIERLTPWIKHWLKESIKSNTEKIIILDLGAGSGRHTSYFKEFSPNIIEIDSSREMLKLNKQDSYQIQATAEYLPIRSNKLDLVSSIATIHHIQSKNNRIQAVSEIDRILRKDGFVIITVWRFYQPKFMKLFKEQMHSMSFLKCTQEIGDTNVLWHSISESKVVFDRFYHLFRAGEFTQLMRPFSKWVKLSFGKKSPRENFLFIGIKRSK